MLIKSAVTSCVKQHLLKITPYPLLFLQKPNPLPTERAVGAYRKSNVLLKSNLGGLFRGPF